MPYAIQERGFEYNDEFFEINRGVSFRHTYEDEAQARKDWIALERQSLEEIDLMQREPLAMPSRELENDPIFQTLLAKLQEFGIPIDDAIKEQMEENYYYADNEQLKLHQLNDGQLLDLLLVTKCNMYCLTEFESIDDSYRYVLQFCQADLMEYNLTKENYLPTTHYDDGYQICNASYPDELFESELFNDIEPERPLITHYMQEDEQSVLLQALLNQYDKYFDLVKNGERTKLHYIGGNIQALRAVNEVLSNPYFKVQKLNYRELEALNQRQKEAMILAQTERMKRRNARSNQSKFWQSLKRWFGKKSF